MAATTTNSLTGPAFRSVTALPVRNTANKRRRITPQAGKALSILGHAIEYLTDEFVHNGGGSLTVRNPQIEAVQILMALNREIYFNCEEIPTLSERISSLMHRLLH